MLGYSLGYKPQDRKSAEAQRGRIRKDCPWTVAWMDSVYENHCVRDTFVTMPSGYRAHAIYLYAPRKTALTAVVVHGYKVRAEGMLHIAYLYNHDMGCNVLLPDLYGQGRREGGRAWAERGRPRADGMARPLGRDKVVGGGRWNILSEAARRAWP